MDRSPCARGERGGALTRHRLGPWQGAAPQLRKVLTLMKARLERLTTRSCVLAGTWQRPHRRVRRQALVPAPRTGVQKGGCTGGSLRVTCV